MVLKSIFGHLSTSLDYEKILTIAFVKILSVCAAVKGWYVSDSLVVSFLS